MKKKSLITLVCSFICILSSSFTLIGCSEKSTKGLDYFPLSNNTYAVEVGEAKYVEEIIIPAKHKGKAVTMIGANAFSGCQSLRKVILDKNISHLPQGLFDSCINLTAIEVDDENNYYSSQDGILYNKKKTQILHAPKKITEATLPNTLTAIQDHSFLNCTALTTILIPKSITSIGFQAFCNCIKLKNVYYTGSKQEWETIYIDMLNSELNNATIYYDYYDI